MRRRQYVTSPPAVDVEEKSNFEEKEGNKVALRSSSEEKQAEGKFGDHLSFDIVNSFCEKLRTACHKNIEALFEIQPMTGPNMEKQEKHVSGKKLAIQVLYETQRSQYVLVCYHPGGKLVRIYDSMQRCTNEGKPRTDNLFYGYRAIGTLIDIARGKDPAKFIYNPKAISDFVMNILSEQKPTWEMFETVELGSEKEYSGEYVGEYSMRISAVTKVASSENLKNIIETPIPKEIPESQIEGRVGACGESGDQENIKMFSRILQYFKL